MGFFKNDRATGANVAISAIMTLIVVGVMLYVGLQVMDGVEGTSSFATGDTFYNTSEAVTDGVESSFSLSGTMMLIIIAGAIIALLLSFVVF